MCESEGSLKVCDVCKEAKPLTEFYPEPRNLNGVMHQCKKCYNTYQVMIRRTKRQLENPVEILPITEKKCKFCGQVKELKDLVPYTKRDGTISHRAQCLECRADQKKESYQRNIESNHIYQHKYNTSESKSIQNKKWKQGTGKVWQDKPTNKIAKSLRDRLYQALKRNKKQNHTLSYIGCTLRELKTHLKKTAPEGFTWDQHNFQGYHIDHILPVSSFDLTKEEEIKKCFNWTNLQILSRFDNQSKSNKIS